MYNSWDLQLTLVGTNHKFAPINLRERLLCQSGLLPDRLEVMTRNGGAVKEAVILSTCNRTEVYALAPRDANIVGYLTGIMSEWSGIGFEELRPILYSSADEEAVTHLIAVASGLDSLVIGEQQIQDQVRDAARTAAETGTNGRFLYELFQYACRAATHIRKQSGLEVETLSVSSAAVSLLKELSHEHSIKTVLLVGAGKMISLAARDLTIFADLEVLVANRTFQRANELARQIGAKPVTFDQISAALQKADAVLTCTSSFGYIIGPEDLLDGGSNLRGRIVLIDASVPRNIDPAVSGIPGVQLYNLDDLAPFVQRMCQSYLPKITRAEELVRFHAEKFNTRVRTCSTNETLRDLRRLAEEIREKELARALHRLGVVSEREKEILDLLTQRIVNKLLHEPTAKLKEQAGNGDGETYETLVRELFAIRQDTQQ